MNGNQISILYSSDDNYAQHMGVSIYSLLDHNRSFERINIYVIDNDISESNLRRLEAMVSEFDNAEITLIQFAEWKSKLDLKLEWNISLSSYARLFVSSMLPSAVDRVLYLDCDMIICSDLHTLWATDLGDCLLGAVQDSVSADTKNAIGIKPQEKYFNAGMLLINLDQWRQDGLEEKFLRFIEEHNGTVRHHDQGVLNGTCFGSVRFLPLRYNLMTIHYVFNTEQILKYYHETAPFFTDAEIAEAKTAPTILHFTPSFTSRPWVKGCKHPLKGFYWELLNKTPWAGAAPQRNTTKYYIRLVEWLHRVFKR